MGETSSRRRKLTPGLMSRVIFEPQLFEVRKGREVGRVRIDAKAVEAAAVRVQRAARG